MGVLIGVKMVMLFYFQSYTTFTFLCRNKPECNSVHSYIVFLPVSIVYMRTWYFWPVFFPLKFGPFLLYSTFKTVCTCIEKYWLCVDACDFLRCWQHSDFQYYIIMEPWKFILWKCVVHTNLTQILANVLYIPNQSPLHTKTTEVYTSEYFYLHNSKIILVS